MVPVRGLTCIPLERALGGEALFGSGGGGSADGSLIFAGNLIGTQSLVGTSGDDVVVGDGEANVIDTRGGEDAVFLEDGADELTLGDDMDVVVVAVDQLGGKTVTDFSLEDGIFLPGVSLDIEDLQGP